MVEAASSQGAGKANAGRSAAWLHSDYEAELWVIDTDDHDLRLERSRLDFRYMLPNGADLTHPSNWHWLETVKTYAYNIRGSEKCTTAKGHQARVRHLTHLVAWAILRGRNSFSELLPSDVVVLAKEAAFGAPFMLRYAERMAAHLREREQKGLPLPSRVRQDGHLMVDQDALCREAHLSRRATMFCGDLVHNAAIAQGLRPASPEPPKPVEKKARNWMLVAELLAPLQYLYERRFHIDVDGPLFEPFPQGSARAGRAVGVAVGKTPTPPAKAYMFLLDRSLRWVTEYGPYLLAALNAHRQGKLFFEPQELCGAPGSPFPLAENRLSKDDRPDLETAITFLVVAAYVVVGAFTARRKTELLRLRRGCFRGSAEEGYWLRSYIAKTLREDDETPCPKCVGVAVDMLEQLSDQDLLFRWRSPFDATRKLEPNKVLRRFCDFIELPTQENGRPWTFSSHQLRRMFAVIYVHRWHVGDLESLSHHLRHFDLRMTKRYVTDDEFASMLDEEQRKFTYALALEVAEGSRAVGGKAGTRLKQLMARLRKSTQVHGVERLPKLVERLVDRTQTLVKTNPWSYCLCPDSRAGAARAECRAGERSEDASGANFAEAKPETCRTCTFNMTDPRFAPFLETELRRAELVLAANPAPMLRSALERRTSELGAYLSEVRAARPV